MEFDIAAIIQGYAQGYFLMADEDGDNGVVFQPWKPHPNSLGWAISLPKSLQRVLNQERFTVAINHDFKAVVAGCAEQALVSPELQAIGNSTGQAGLIVLKLGRATNWLGILAL